MSLNLHDVIVVGAGPGGSAAAHYLARAGLDVLLLDKSDFPRDKTCGDALSPAAVHILDDMGALPGVLAGGAYRVNGMEFYAPDGGRLVEMLPPHPPFPQHALVAVRVTGVEGDPGALTVTGARAGQALRFRGRLVVLAVGAGAGLLQAVGLLKGQPAYARAARVYFQGVKGLRDLIQIRFDGLPLPGYGWVFPLSESSANVGAGFYRRTRAMPATAGQMLEGFLQHPPLREMLREADVEGPVKGFPLRTDFNRSPVIGEGLLAVGESAGLVNPFTGEGIDYALESGQMAARAVQRCFTGQRSPTHLSRCPPEGHRDRCSGGGGDFSKRALRPYERAMRRRFQRTFVLTHLLREVYMNRWLLNPLVRAGNRWPGVGRVLVEVLLSYKDAGQALSPGVVARVLWCATLGRRHPDRGSDYAG
ncbi:MAG: FAD-dependent monooxygenase [Chloroflexi bacterium]|nr:FAD-dependent monooxygenase [Chloroflexota bacterium]